jgi:FtsZ-binding cell division protein ZapB
MNKTQQQIKRNTTDIKLLLQIEKYKAEVERLKGVRDRQSLQKDQSYFQGHIDALIGTVNDLEDLLNLPSSRYEGI